MRKLRKLSAEMIVALGATIVGICALTVSIIETRIMQDEQEQQRIYQRASVWPNLTFQIDSDKDVHRLYLINNGVGLAMIESFDISVDKNPVENWRQAIGAMFGDDNVLRQSFGISGGSVYPAGKSTLLMTVELERNDFFSEAQRLDVSVCYCSVYNECWVQSGDGRGEKVKQCPERR